MATRREVLRLASLATAAGCTLSFPRNSFAAERTSSGEIERNHSFHAESSVLSAEAGSRLAQVLPRENLLSVAPEGGHLSRKIAAFELPGFVSFKSGYTQVSGSGDFRSGQGWATMSTSVIEGLNIANIVTADRVVAQVSTEHPTAGYVPSVSFLGTHFENLRIAGHAVNFQLDLNMLGEKPDDDIPYLSHPEFLRRVQSQSERLSSSITPRSSLVRYGGSPIAVDGGEAIEFSLVHQTSGNFQGSTFGHVIELPNFGTIRLATVKLSQSDYQGGTAKATTVQLTMVETETDDDGTTGSGTTVTNGGTRP